MSHLAVMESLINALELENVSLEGELLKAKERIADLELRLANAVQGEINARLVLSIQSMEIIQ